MATIGTDEIMGMLGNATIGTPTNIDYSQYSSENIDDLIIRVHDKIYEDYKSYEEKEASKAIKKYFENEIDIGAVTNDGLLEIISSRYSEINTFTLSLSQARKSRAGKTFENIFFKIVVAGLGPPRIILF